MLGYRYLNGFAKSFEEMLNVYGKVLLLSLLFK